jgi:hypothetical protein
MPTVDIVQHWHIVKGDLQQAIQGHRNGELGSWLWICHIPDAWSWVTLPGEEETTVNPIFTGVRVYKIMSFNPHDSCRNRYHCLHVIIGKLKYREVE